MYVQLSMGQCNQVAMQISGTLSVLLSPFQNSVLQIPDTLVSRTLMSFSSTQGEHCALLGFSLLKLRSRKCLQAESYSNCRDHRFCFLSLTVTVLLCLPLIFERSYFIYCVQFPYRLRRNGQPGTSYPSGLQLFTTFNFDYQSASIFIFFSCYFMLLKKIQPIILVGFFPSI